MPTTFPFPITEPDPLDFKSGSDVSKSIATSCRSVRSGNFSGLRGSLAAAKGISLSKNLKLFGYNTFIWSCIKFFNKKDSIFSLIKFREKYFVKKFNKNLNSDSKVEEITESEIIKKYGNKFKVIPENVAKYFSEKILKLNNLSIGNLDHNELEFLQLKGLLDKDLIKPLYLS